MQPSRESTLSTVNTGHLLRVLGVGFGVAVIIGNTIGAGILRTPGEVAAQLPHAWLFLGVWLAGGLYALLGANSIAELGTAIPRSGGQYVFAQRALGNYPGFIVGWSDWLSTCGSTAAVSIVVGEYSSSLIPRLQGQMVPIALTAAISLALLQWRGIRWGSGFQNVTSLLKAAGFLALVVACFAFGSQAGAAEQSLTPTGFPLIAALVIALQSVLYTYDGWTGVIYFSEEVRDPARDVPRALFGGVLSVTAIYLLVNLALVYIMPISEIAGQKLAIGAAAAVVFGQHGDTVVRVLTIVSMLAAINAFHLMASRVLFAMSCDGLCTEKAERVNEGGTPAIALFISTVVAVLFILTGTFESVIAVLAFFFVANYTLSFISVFVLRLREPDLPRPFKAWGYPWTTAAALLGSLAFLIGAVAGDTINSAYALLLLAASYPAFMMSKWLSRR